MNCNKIKTIIIKIITNQPKIITNKITTNNQLKKITTNKSKNTQTKNNNSQRFLVFVLVCLNISMAIHKTT
jgi:hypothetical protein